MRIVIILVLNFCGFMLFSQAIPSSVVNNGDGTWELLRGGEPYYVKGVGSDSPKEYAVLKNAGANSVRTWGVGPNYQQFLDSAYEHGLSVMVGLWVQHENQGFNYDNELAVSNQKELFRQNVLLYKDHPAVLGWGIGNEVNLNGITNKKVWDHINDVSEMIHELDGEHFTCTVLAGSPPGVMQDVKTRVPDIDLVGVNMYGGIGSVYNSIVNSGIDKPYMLTEWGINGPWEVGTSAWGTPLEVNSSEKASVYKNRYNNHIVPYDDLCLGSYAFLWNTREENDPIWFNMWVKNERTEVIDELQRAWSGSFPDNRAPKVLTSSLNGEVQSSNIVLNSLTGHEVKVFANDPENDELSYEFLLRTLPNSAEMVLEDGFTFRGIPGVIEQDGSNVATLNLNVENNNTHFKLYAYVRDGKGNVGFSSLQFRTEFSVEDGENFFVVDKDCYIRDGAYSNSQMGSQDASNLEVKASSTDGFSREILLSFDRSDHPTDFESAKLKLYGSAPLEVDLSILVSDAGQLWEETELNWNSYDPSDMSELGSLIVGEEESYYEIDVTEFLSASTESTVAFSIRGKDSYLGEPAIFYSKEKGASPPAIEYQQSTSILELENKIHIYPNPSQDYLEVRLASESKYKNVSIYDASGRLLRTMPITKRIHVSDLEDGNYILSFINGKQQFAVSFTKH